MREFQSELDDWVGGWNEKPLLRGQVWQDNVDYPTVLWRAPMDPFLSPRERRAESGN